MNVQTQTWSVSWLFADQLIAEHLLVISNVLREIRHPSNVSFVFQEGKMSAPPPQIPECAPTVIGAPNGEQRLHSAVMNLRISSSLITA